MLIKNLETFDDVKIFIPNVYRDDRGFFTESFNSFIETELNVKFYQDNHSKSKKNVIRGIHYQWDMPMGKLCRVVKGSGFDLILDLRQDSKTYGKYELVFLSEDNFNIVWVPPGYGHAFLSMEDDTHFCYKCSSLHNSNSEGSIYPFDRDLNIQWPISLENAVLSDKDKNSQSFQQYKLNPVF